MIVTSLAIGEGDHSKGLGSTQGQIWLVSGLEEVSDGLSPSIKI